MATVAEQLRAWLAQGAVIAAQLEVQTPAPAATGAVGTAGTTAADWTAPPSPWPIDVRYLSAEQVAKLDADATKRANAWQQALMSAALAGNGGSPVPFALYIYRAGYMTVETLNKPLDQTWTAIYAAYGVTP